MHLFSTCAQTGHFSAPKGLGIFRPDRNSKMKASTFTKCLGTKGSHGANFIIKYYSGHYHFSPKAPGIPGLFRPDRKSEKKPSTRAMEKKRWGGKPRVLRPRGGRGRPRRPFSSQWWVSTSNGMLHLLGQVMWNKSRNSSLDRYVPFWKSYCVKAVFLKSLSIIFSYIS